jgi:hypothetical protein
MGRDPAGRQLPRLGRHEAHRRDGRLLRRSARCAAVAITFRQHIGVTDALRTGSYARTLTFTLSTSNSWSRR